MSLPDIEARFGAADDTTQSTRICGKCKTAHVDTDRGFVRLGWGLVHRRLLCPDCMPKRLRGY